MRIAAKSKEMGLLGVRFAKAKAELKALLDDEKKLRRDQDEALEAVQRQESQVSQEQRVTSASSSSRPVSPQRSRKRPLPTGLIPKDKKKKLAADSSMTPAIWPKSARVTSAPRSS